MNEIRTRVVGRPDQRISRTAPADVPVGEHEVTIALPGPSMQPTCRGMTPAPGPMG